MSRDLFPPDFFRRMDESPDADFYRDPRFVTHLDDATIAALTQVYRELVRPGSHVLDLMSSWVSHLPPDVPYDRVAGLGMNRQELERNPRLTDFIVHDLNATSELPYPDEVFDAVVNAVSIQYLTRPVEVLASVRRVLKPGGIHIIATSHRLFPTKAVAVWQSIEPAERLRLIAAYFQFARGWNEPHRLDRSPTNADPLWIIYATRSAP
jgi:cyclopropane fatty-acyl-phospholipid synthase-like methyltransferase